MRIFAIGDVHGCSQALEKLLETIPLAPEDQLIMLGDYVDRGPGSRQVIERLLALRRERPLVTLMGNHEVMMLQARENRLARSEWYRYGGDATLASYTPHTLAGVPEEHWQFLQSCTPFYETAQHLFVHANLHPKLPLASQPEVTLFWEHITSAQRHVSGKLMICGHTAQHKGLPLDLGPAICIDTYAHGGGWLTCLEVQSRTYWQANQQRETREGTLP